MQTETSEARNKFINSVIRLMYDYDFDGVDLAWQFPEVKVKKHRSTLGSIWNGVKKVFGSSKYTDDKEGEHRDGFTNVIRDLKTQLRLKNKALTLTVLPHVNASSQYILFILHGSSVHSSSKNQFHPFFIFSLLRREDHRAVPGGRSYFRLRPDHS